MLQQYLYFLVNFEKNTQFILKKTNEMKYVAAHMILQQNFSKTKYNHSKNRVYYYRFVANNENIQFILKQEFKFVKKTTLNLKFNSNYQNYI